MTLPDDWICPSSERCLCGSICEAREAMDPPEPAPAQGSTEPREETPDECTGCGRDDGPMYLDPRPRHPRDPQPQYCRDCASDLFGLGDEEPDHA
ncbi:hypothetical protein [Actinomadura geliboluensis]|uniref:hypothetical protein n=1 Tax=Actinomadura geliboluensis TaxID=882440 RepID=UPI0036A99395